MQVIPAMDLLDGQVVRLHRGDYNAVTVYDRDPHAVVARFVEAGARRVHVVDLSGARDGRATQAPLLASLLQRFGASVAVQVGGGIRTVEQVRAYRDAGAERVVVGTRAVEDLSFLDAARDVCDVVVAVDARQGRVATHGWTRETDLHVIPFARSCAAHGAKAVLYTDILRDGTGEGPDLDATAALADAVPDLEVIASGGIGSLDHLRALAARRTIAAVVVGRALYDGRFTAAEALACGAP